MCNLEKARSNVQTLHLILNRKCCIYNGSIVPIDYYTEETPLTSKEVDVIAKGLISELNDIKNELYE